MPILDAHDIAAIWARVVNRVPGAPTTILQDTVDGTTAAISADQKLTGVVTRLEHAHIKLDQAAVKLTQALVKLDSLTGANINTLAVQIATELAARLGGPNGHLMSDGDVDRFADATADIVWVRLQQYLEAQD